MITVDTFLLLFLINKGIRKMELLSYGYGNRVSFIFEMIFAQPDMGMLLV
jgi:manganese transport protein